VYVCGYPFTWSDEVKPFEPFTPVRALPGGEAVKRDAPDANPRRIGYLSHVKAMNSHQGVRLHTGPDGKLYTLYRLGSVSGYPWLLIRIDPSDLSVTPLGRVGAGGRFIFVDNDIYLAGASQIRRVKNVAGGLTEFSL